MRADLSRRIGAAIGLKPTTGEERSAILAAAREADTFDDLPSPVQALLVRVESRPDVIDLLGGGQ
jgi:hypothetical protein